MGAVSATATGGGRWAWMRLRHVLLLALALRLAWAALVPIMPVSDPSAYDELARRLAGGRGYSWERGDFTAYWPVGTSALYGAVYYIFGRDLTVVAIVNALLGTGLVAATYAFARLRFAESLALLAALLLAIWPTWIAFTSIISSELPTNLLFITGIVVALSRRGSWWSRTILSTVLLVGATYVRSNMLPFVILVPVTAAIAESRYRQILPRIILAAVVAALLIAPWAIRNAQVIGAPVPTSTNFGVNLWIGNNPVAMGGYAEPPAPSGLPLPQDEVARDKHFKDHAIAFIKEHPLTYTALSARRLVIALDRETFGVLWNGQGIAPGLKLPLKLAMTGYWYAIFAAGLAGLAIFLRRRPADLWSPYVFLPAATLAAPVLVMATERYHYTLAPFLAIFAAFLVERVGGARSVPDAGRSDLQRERHAA